MRSICVFCGSNNGINPQFATVAIELGKALASAKIQLVYGGGQIGLMGVIADAALQASGKVIGVIPESLLAKEIAHQGLTELKVVKSMHERKALMAELSDGFITLPGGFGTLEEFFEILTWSQLGFHKKPLGLLNVDGYYDNLLKFFDTMIKQKFAQEKHQDLILIANSPHDILNQMRNFKHVITEKWWLTESQL